MTLNRREGRGSRRGGGGERGQARGAEARVEAECCGRINGARPRAPRAINDQVNRSETLIVDRMASQRATAVGYHVQLGCLFVRWFVVR